MLVLISDLKFPTLNMREIVHVQAGQCGNQIGAKVGCAEKILELLKNKI